MRVVLRIIIRELDDSMNANEIGEQAAQEYIIEGHGSENTDLTSAPVGESNKPSTDLSAEINGPLIDNDVPRISTGRELPDTSAARDNETEKIHIFCGNPSVQTIHGIMQFYKDNSTGDTQFASDLICMVGIPTVYNLEDITSFIAPYNSYIRGIRIVKDRSQHSYLALLRFVNKEKAEEFFDTMQDQRFNSIDSYLCHLVFVSNLEFGKVDIHYGTLAPGPLVELPHCTVCLERLDENTTGMLTVLCNHTFHCECMKTCVTCPVCRYLVTPPEQSRHTCMVCGNEDNLWLCLICGYIGCGRYEGGHARGHFESTNHTYCMCMEERCVWDYVGDNYVHRLIQNKTDGKLVAVQDEDGVMAEKFESLTLEYSYLLSQQLESQRDYFEKKLMFAEEDAMDRIVSVETEVLRLTDVKDKLRRELEVLEKDKKRLENKVDTVSTKMSALKKELVDEQELNKSLQVNQKELIQQAVSAKKLLLDKEKRYEEEILGLKEQIADLMFHFQSQDSIKNSGLKEEIQNGNVHIVPGPSKVPASSKYRSPKKKK